MPIWVEKHLTSTRLKKRILFNLKPCLLIRNNLSSKGSIPHLNMKNLGSQSQHPLTSRLRKDWNLKNLLKKMKVSNMLLCQHSRLVQYQITNSLKSNIIMIKRDNKLFLRSSICRQLISRESVATLRTRKPTQMITRRPSTRSQCQIFQNWSPRPAPREMSKNWHDPRPQPLPRTSAERTSELDWCNRLRQSVGRH